MFYRAVIQAVLIFGVGTWVLSDAISRKLDGVHMGFLNKITVNREVQQRDGTWRCVAAEKVLNSHVYMAFA